MNISKIGRLLIGKRSLGTERQFLTSIKWQKQAMDERLNEDKIRLSDT